MPIYLILFFCALAVIPFGIATVTMDRTNSALRFLFAGFLVAGLMFFTVDFLVEIGAICIGVAC